MPAVALLVAAVVVLSSIQGISWPQVASAAPKPRPAGTLSPVPPGSTSTPAPPRATAPARPSGDFRSLSTAGGGAGSHFDPKRSTVVSRTMFTTTYRNPDGTQSLLQSTAPLNVQDGTGAWQPVDTSLHPVDGSRSGTARHPLSPSLAATANDPSVLAVHVGGDSASLALDQAAPSRVKVSKDSATYPDIAPDTDLDYQVTADAVKETVLLKKAPAPGRSSWRFHLRTSLNPVVDAAGEVELRDAGGAAKIVLPPIETWDSSGTPRTGPALTGGTYQLAREADGWLLTVSVDDKWLHDPKRVYPVHVDPTFSFGVDVSHDYRSDGFVCDNCGLRIGNSLHLGDSYNRAVFHFDISSLWGKTVVGAQMNVSQDPNVSESVLTWGANLYHASAFNFSGIGEFLASALVGNTGSFVGGGFTSFVANAVNTRNNGNYFALVGSEVAGTWTYKHLIATMLVDTGTAPPAPTLSAPADNSVLTGLTPTLSVNPVTDPDGDAVSYCFQVATGTDAQSGVVVNSGCQPSPNWSVPPGVLQDGTAYTWRASAFSGITTVTPTWIGHFRVDQRIGAHGPAPTDTLGPVTVNLANGNASVSDGGPTFTTVGGGAGLTFSYNSQQTSPSGLRASYYNDLSQNGNINPAQQPALVRTEPQVNVNWGPASPFPPVLGANYYVVIWEGYFQAPATGTYLFAGVHSGSANIWVNGNQVYASTGPSDLNWPAATGVALTAGQQVPIKIQLTKDTDAVGQMRLFTETTDGTTVPSQLVPSSWLFTSEPPALPQGWTLSSNLDESSLVYTRAQNQDATIVLTDGSGAKHTWTKTSAGGYTPPQGEDGVLALDTSGKITVTEGSEVYTFNADGTLAAESDVADASKPATLQHTYSGAPARLTQITDPVSGRSHVLHYNRPGDNCYGGTSVPPNLDALPPAQMLCKISYWDGTETDVWYLSGTLYAVQNPGDSATLYGYNAGVLTSVVDPLVRDWAVLDASRATAGIYTVVGYTTNNGVQQATSVTAPTPQPGAAAPKHGYRYDPAHQQTFVDVAGLTPAVGYARKVTYDGAYRLITSTDATGKMTSQTWNNQDQVVTSTDAAGRESSTIYDYDNRPIFEYGAAPASCYNGSNPGPTCNGSAVQTNYDEGILGLSSAYYPNTTLTGSASVYATGVGRSDGQMTWNWGATGAPAGVPAAGWSARFTGEIQMPDAGTYSIGVWGTDGVRLWIDDTLVVDQWSDKTVTTMYGNYTKRASAAITGCGWSTTTATTPA